MSGGYAIALAALSKIARRWNQTGQKFAGEPDIATSFFPEHTTIMWILIIVTYLDVCQRICRRMIPWLSLQFAAPLSTLLILIAFTFKLAFTSADAPELLRDMKLFNPLLNAVQKFSLVAQARAVFIGIALGLTAAVIVPKLKWPQSHRKQSAQGTKAPLPFPITH